jgi:hypothetical protein
MTATGRVTTIEPNDHPLDIVEEVVTGNDWAFDRPAEDELMAEITGRHCDLRMMFLWREDMNALQFTCFFDARVPAGRRREVRELVATVNEKLWLGHFDIASDDGMPMFRHTLPVRGTGGPTTEQVEDMLETAIGETDRFVPALQMVSWGGRSAEEAFAAAMFETVGEA